MSYPTLGERLRALRVLAGQSARAIDRLAGLAAGHTRKLEDGVWSPGERTARTLASLYGVSLDWLINGKGAVPSARRVAAALRAALDASARKAG